MATYDDANDDDDDALVLFLQRTMQARAGPSNQNDCSQLNLSFGTDQSKTCQEAQEKGYKMLVGSSGGNAGLAMAYAASKLDMPLTLFIPKSAPQMMLDLIKVCM